MEKGVGMCLFEISELDFKKSFWRRGRLATVWILGAISACLLLILPAWGFLAAVEPVVYLASWGTGGLMLALAWFYLLEARGLNRFGIYERGLAPPRKPKAYRRQATQLIIPLSDMNRIEYRKMGTGFLPQSHFSVVLHFPDGEAFEFDATELLAQSRWKEAEVARAQEILERLFGENWKGLVQPAA